ncbi:hypothetical protein [Kitasatospora sp. NBC_00070]|uniref:hypothetical protein n=1 Tax=Kitasatospora sp. NBC_00070 TaxID=2975962 RepID=UPI0038603223
MPARETGRDARALLVWPELVVEVAFDGLQRSPRYPASAVLAAPPAQSLLPRQCSIRYPAGPALRFARVVRYRPDKSAAEAETGSSVRELATVEGL